MKFSTVVAALLVGSAAAFAPSTSERASTSLNMDRRNVMGAIAAAGAVVALPQMASADGSISSASIQRARYKFGSRISALKGAVAAGDFAAVAEEKSAFILFNSGAYPRVKDKPKKAEAIAGTNAIFSAIRSKDKAALKSAYDAFVNDNGISDFSKIQNDSGQGYSADFDYRVRTPQAAIYVR